MNKRKEKHYKGGRMQTENKKRRAREAAQAALHGAEPPPEREPEEDTQLEVEVASDEEREDG